MSARIFASWQLMERAHGLPRYWVKGPANSDGWALVCDVPSAPACSDLEALAAGRLIAAAPDLLAALKALVGQADLGELDLESGDRELIETARAAIEKAEGNV